MNQFKKNKIVADLIEDVSQEVSNVSQDIPQKISEDLSNVSQDVAQEAQEVAHVMTEVVPRCATCDFYEEFRDPICHRYPPDRSGKKTHTEPTYWCGEYK